MVFIHLEKGFTVGDMIMFSEAALVDLQENVVWLSWAVFVISVIAGVLGLLSLRWVNADRKAIESWRLRSEFLSDELQGRNLRVWELEDELKVVLANSESDVELIAELYRENIQLRMAVRASEIL